MTREQVLINHIREYLDSGMWQYEACYLNKDDLKVIIKALEQEPILDKIRAEMENDWQLKKYPSSPFSCGLRRAIEIIDKYRAESEDKE